MLSEKGKDFVQGMAHLCKAIFSDISHASEISEIKAFFRKALDSFMKYIDNNINDLKEIGVVKTAFNILKEINNCYRSEASSDLESYIIKIATNHLNIMSKIELTIYYSQLVEANRKSLDFIKALEYAKLAYRNYEERPKNYTDAEALIILYNIALCIRSYDPEKSIEYFTKAEVFDPTDLDVIVDKMKSYLLMDKLEEAIKQTEKITDIESRNLHIFACYKASNKMPTLELLTKVNDSEPESVNKTVSVHTDQVRNQVNMLIKVEQEGALSLPKLEVEKLIVNNDTSAFSYVSHVIIILAECKRSNDWKSGLEVLKTMYTKFPIAKNHTILELKRYEFYCYFCNGLDSSALEVLISLQTFHNPLSTIAEDTTHDLSLMYIYDQIDYHDFENAKSLTTKFIINDLENRKLINLINASENIISHSSSIISQISEDIISSKEPSPSASNFHSLIDWAATAEELAEMHITPKQVHTYCQAQKAHLYAKKINGTSDKSDCSWKIEGRGAYSTSSKTVEIYKLDNKLGFYAAIDDKILSKLDSSTLNQFLTAIGKGLSSRTAGTNGIKFLDNKIIELKIDEDIRLYTKVIYKNADGKYLIIFNNRGNHEAVKKALTLSSGINTIELVSSEIPVDNSMEEDEVDVEVQSLSSTSLHDVQDCSLSGVDKADLVDLGLD